MAGKNTDSSQQVAPTSPVQRIAALKRRTQLLATGVKAVSTALAVVRRIKSELEKEHIICDDDTLKFLEKMKGEENKHRDKFVALSGELDSEVHHVEAEISKLENRMTELEVELMKRNSNLGMQLKELKEDQLEVVKKNSRLELELKELSGEKVELEKRNLALEPKISKLKGEKMELSARSSSLELELSEIKEDKVELELKLKNQKKHLISEKNEWKKEDKLLRGRNETLTNQKINLEKVVKKLLKEKEEALAAGNANEENIQQIVTPLNNLVDSLPNTMKTILAPKGSITGDEFGMFMGGFINMAACIVTHANRKVKITAMTAFASLTSLMISAMFNNIVTYILTVQNDQPGVVKAFTSLPWIMLGGVLPIAVGGFIPSWGIRAIVTGIVTLVLKMAFAIFLVVNYKVPKAHGFYFVILGVVGLAIAAGVPDLLEWIVKRSTK